MKPKGGEADPSLDSRRIFVQKAAVAKTPTAQPGRAQQPWLDLCETANARPSHLPPQRRGPTPAWHRSRESGTRGQGF